jgi:hypothetical protein
MKKIWLLLPVILLTGCLSDSPVPIKQVWPTVPKELLEACPDLKQMDPKVDKLSDIIEVVSDNYSQYYDCKSKVDDWIVWYNGQKKIFDGK